jgi:hypothetical protein
MGSNKVYIDAEKYDAAMYSFFIEKKISSKNYNGKDIKMFDKANGIKWMCEHRKKANKENYYIFKVVNCKKFLLAKIKYGFETN